MEFATPESVQSSLDRSRAKRWLQFLGDITQQINQGHSLQRVFDLVYERLREFIPYDRIAVALADERRERLSITAVKADGKVVLRRGYSGQISGSSLEGLLKNGSIRIINDLQHYLSRKPDSESTRLIVKEGMRSSLTLPLLVGGRPVGVMFFSSRRPDVYLAEHEELLRSIVGQMAILVERSGLQDVLQERTEYLENLLQNTVEAIIVEDRDGRIVTWNEGARRIYGWTAEEAVGRSIEMTMPSERVETGEWKSLRDRVEAEGYLRDYETERVTRDGRRLTIQMTATLLRTNSGRPVGRSLIQRDVTHMKRLQEDLVRSQSLAAVGEMAATVAHEIKNPLAGISGAIQVLGDGMAPEDPRRPVVKEILEQIRRLDRTVRDLLDFSRPAVPQRHDVELGESFRHVWDLLAPQRVAAGIRFVLEGAAGVRVSADPHLLHQVWVNLLQNGIEAMGARKGELRVCVEPGDPVRVEVRDAGTGIDPAHAGRLFHPFFSTKTRGTGLGLAISRKIVEAHRGRIWCEGRPGEGSSFFVEIPR
jgi:PAS domain S-box-containing protein